MALNSPAPGLLLSLSQHFPSDRHLSATSLRLYSNPPPLGSFLSLNSEGGQLNPPPPPGRAAFQPPAWYALEVRWNPQRSLPRALLRLTSVLRVTGFWFGVLSPAWYELELRWTPKGFLTCYRASLSHCRCLGSFHWVHSGGGQLNPPPPPRRFGKLLDLEPPQIDLFWVVPERHHRPRSPQEGPFPGWVPVSIRKKTQMGLQGGLRKSGYFLIPTLMLNLKVKIAADGTKNGILPD